MNDSGAVTKKGLGRAGIAALGVCATCCALPLLAAAGIGGGAVSTLAGWIRPGADLVVAALVGVAVFGVTLYRGRARLAAGCDTACDVERGCGCASSAADDKTILSTLAPGANEAIVCTADTEDKPTVRAQLDGYRAAFAHLLRVEKYSGGVRWVFANHPGLDIALRNLAENEHRCCAFFKFELTISGDTLVWETTADQRAAAVLDEFARLPERLSQHARGSEVQPIKAAIGGAGLRFAADAPEV